MLVSDAVATTLAKLGAPRHGDATLRDIPDVLRSSVTS